MNFFKKTHGGVSIFLTIILVPVIAVCTIFIDVSRVYLGSDLAASSADLSLNTVMSQYDVDLEQYYGMMASCQNVEEFYDVAEEYFAACMQSQGVAATDSQEWAQKLREILGGNVTYDDLIRIDDSNTTAEITSLDDADLANAAMVKQQITEFMKYRAPVDLISEVSNGSYSGLYSKFQQIGEKSRNLVYEAKVQDAKTKYYTAENDLLQKALEAYEKLVEYESYQLDDEYINGTKTCYENLEESFTELHADYVEYWSNIEWKWNDQDMESVSSLISGASGNSYDGDKVSAGTLKDLLDDFFDAEEDFKNKRDAVIEVLNSNDYVDLESPEVSKAQYWLHIEHILNKSGSASYSNSIYKEYVDSYIKMIETKESLDSAYANRDDGSDEEDDSDSDSASAGSGESDEESKDAKDEDYDGRTIETAYNDAGNEYSTETGSTDTSRIETISSRAASYYSDTNMKVREEHANSRIKSKVQSGSDFKSDELLKERYDRIYNANKKIEELIPLVKKMADLADDYHDAYGSWCTEVENAENAGVDSSESTIVEQSRTEIDEIEANSSSEVGDDELYTTDVKIDIEGSDCTEFADTLEEVSKLLESYMDTAESIKYHGACILGTDLTTNADNGASGINTLDMFDIAAKTAGTSEKNVSNDAVPVRQDELNTYISDTWEYDDTAIDTLVALTTTNSPCFHESDDYSYNTSKQKIDKFLHRQFDELTSDGESKSSKTKGILDALKKLVKNPLPDDWGEYENIHNSTNEIKDEDNLPSQGSGENTGELVGGLSKNEDVTKDTESTVTMATALQDIVDIIEDVGLGARDNLYTTDYIMNMFSYETHYMETVYGQTRANMEDNDSKTGNIYNVGLDEAIKPGNAKNLFDTETAWNIMKDDDLTKTYNKSLTNKIINKMEGDSNDGIATDNTEKLDENGKLAQDFAGNNWSYGNEVEYILSGSDNETNKARLEAVLYFIRYAFNFAPVYEHYWDDNNIVNPVATGVAKATCGVIPIPLTKLIICMGICAAESAVDEDYILAGLPVKLSKGSEELFISIGLDPGDLKKKIISKDSSGSIFSIGENIVKDEGIILSYSDYLSIFLFIELSVNADNIYKRTADVIQVNLDKNPNITNYGDDGFQMSKAKTYFQIDTKVRIKPMMVALPYGIQYGTGSLLDTDTWNTFTYTTVEGY